MRQLLIVSLLCCVLPGCQKIKSWLISFVEFEGEVDPSPEAIPLAKAENVDLVPVAKGLAMPTDIMPMPGKLDEIVVLQKTGAASLVQVNSGQVTPLFSVSVETATEMGLLGIAFHPSFQDNQLFYLHYNPKEGEQRTRIAEWIWQNPPREKRVLLEFPQPYPNHNGGQIRFGPDGMLYIGMGDGGWANDPDGHGQNRETLLGTILRIDVASGKDKPYTIPSTNPFVGHQTFRPEIYAWGLRNPWKFDFDAEGRLVVGDVGQNELEEVSLVERGGNYGWNVFEGESCFDENDLCEKKNDYRPPIWQYARREGTSITGGVMIQDPRFPAWRDSYLVGDYGSGRIWVLRLPSASDGKGTATELGDTALNISTFGVDGRGRLYLGDFGGGTIYQFRPRS